MDLKAWLTELGFEEHAEAFSENGIDAELLLELTNEDLKDLGVTRLADRKRMLGAIAKLSTEDRTSGAQSSREAFREGERRQVTVMFADLTGFTQLSNELGAEQTHALLNRYFDTVDKIVESYGGTIDKHIGDAVMAVFGAPIAHTDDPERAVRAALDIHSAMEEFTREQGRELTAHIGIASGQVVASGTGSRAHREYTVTGDTVNLASRLHDLAKPGETLISKGIYDAVSHITACSSHGDAEIKGFQALVEFWAVDQLRDVREAAQSGEFVGRNVELRQFKAGLEACLEQARGHSILVRGEPGIGKTRLVEEFSRIAESHQYSIHRALVLDFGVGKGKDAVRALVRSLLSIPPGSDKQTRQAAADRAITEGCIEEKQRVFLNDLLDLPQPSDLLNLFGAMDNETRNSGKQEALSTLLVAKSKVKPRLIVIEDIHWADKPTYEYLVLLASTVARCAAVLIMTSRIEGMTTETGWLASLRGSPMTSIELQPLRNDEAAQLAQGLGDKNKALIEAFVARAEGNPLFLEQLMRNASERSDEDIPDTLQGLVLARMDRLANKDREALQAASVMGQRFSLEALRYLLKDDGYTCDGLLEHRLIRPEGPEFLFAHALIRDGVYASLLRARARELHARASEWFADLDLALRAEHLDRAEDPQAAIAYLEAAKSQTLLHRFEQAAALAKRGIEIAQDREVKLELTTVSGEVLRDKGDFESSMAAYCQARELTESAEERCGVLLGLASVMRLTDEYEAALDLLEEAQAIGETQSLTTELSKLHHLRGNLYFPLGRVDECLDEHETALVYARQEASTELEALALGGLGDAEYARGRLLTAHKHFLECIRICQEQGYTRTEVANQNMIGGGGTFYYMNELPKALEASIIGAEKAEQIGHERAALLAHLGISLVCHEMGDLARAEEHASRMKELIERLGTKRFMARALHQIGKLQLASGKRQDAVELFREAMSISRETGVRYCGPSILGGLARVVRDSAERKAIMEEAEELLAKGCVAHNYLEFYLDAMEVSYEEGDWDRLEHYASALEEYTRVEPMPRTDFLIARGRALASFGRGDRSALLTEELIRLRNQAESVGLNWVQAALDTAVST